MRNLHLLQVLISNSVAECALKGTALVFLRDLALIDPLMMTSFFIAAALLLVLVILRNYSTGEDVGRYVAKAEHLRLTEEEPESPLAKMSEDDFLAYFEWLRRRRFWIYLMIFVGIAAPITWLTMSLLSVLKLFADPGPWMWGFIAVFVLVAGLWISAFGALWLHRTRRDPSLARNLNRWPGPDSD